MIIHDVEQRTDEWRALRLGKVTASRVADLLAKTKTGWGASRANYAAQLVAERLTGVPADNYVSQAMQFGIDTEAEAVNAYEFVHGSTVTAVGFVAHPEITMAGASPDGLVSDDGLIEVKVPNTATHIETLLGGSIPSKYIVQMQFQMACTGRAWCDFVSFDPRLPEPMRLFVRRLERSDAEIDAIETEVSKFLAEVDSTIRKLTAIYKRQQQAAYMADPANMLAAG